MMHSDQMKSRSLKILSFTADGRVLPHTLRDVQDVLRKMGHEVIVLDMRTMGRYQRLVAFADAIIFHRPDVLFTIDAAGILPFLISVLPDPPQVITWFYDDPLKILSQGFRQINRSLTVFVWDQEYVAPLKKRGFDHVEYQPFATNLQVNRPMAERNYIYDVSFVGTWSAAREDWLRCMTEQGVQIHVFGDKRWGNVVCDKLIYEGYASNREDCPRIYNTTKVNLNITSEQLLTALPVRVFDVLGCGGFLVSDMREDIKRLFDTGQDLIACEDAVTMAEKVRYYLEHDDERERIVRAGRKKVQSKYTFERVVPEILDRAALALHSSPAQNHEGKPEDYARAAWLIGMSCLKSGDYHLASQLFHDILKLCDPDDTILVPLCILAARVANAEQLESFLSELRLRRSHWIEHETDFYSLLQGGEFPLWNKVYEEFFNILPT